MATERLHMAQLGWQGITASFAPRNCSVPDAALGAAETTGVDLAISFAVAAEDVRHLQRGNARRGSGRAGFLQLPPVERARGVADCRGGDLRVAGRRRQVAMPEQHLDDADV